MKIKASLQSSKKASPEVRIEQEIDADVYEKYFKGIGIIHRVKGRDIHCVNSVLDVDLKSLFGDKWFERILNKNCDFCYVTKDTIRFWLHRRPLLKEFVAVGNQFLESHVENSWVLVFTFVISDGVKRQYFTTSWK